MLGTLRKKARYSATWRRIWDVGARLAIATITIILVLAGLTAAQATGDGRHASASELQMYYEVHAAGRRVVLLLGAFGTTVGWGPLLEILAKERQAIAVEPLGRGHAGDIDRPLSFEQMAKDAAALLKEMKLDEIDVFGYSTVSLYAAIRNPQLVNGTNAKTKEP